jgi:tetratricopeptide (TPR) repeat protein
LPQQQFRLFLSSPSDVRPERDRAKIVIDRLNGELEGAARIELLRWEDAFYTAAHSFQAAINQAVTGMSGTDLVVCIVWSRIGLKLNPTIWRRPDQSPYESGTVLEFETACEVSRQRSGAPDVYLFRKTADVLYHADRVTEEMEQHQLLEAVWRRWTQTDEGYNVSGYQRFNDLDEFERRFEGCLRQWLARRGVGVGGPIWERALQGSPFCGLTAFDAAHAPVFFGREAAIEKAIAKLRRLPFLLLIGASGSGKSSLLRAGLVPRITRPGTIPDIDLWRAAIVLPGADPITSLAESLSAEAALGRELAASDFGTGPLLARLLAAGGDMAVAVMRGALERAAARRAAEQRYDAPRPARLLIAVDQVERLFVEVAAERVEAFAALLRAFADARLAYVVAALRSDAYGRFQRVPSFVALREAGGTHDLLPPTGQELEDVVTRPVAACRPPLAFELDSRGRSLTEVLVADARGGDALPLLQMTLQRLYEAEERREQVAQARAASGAQAQPDEPLGLLRFADYPGMGAAVTNVAEEAFTVLDAAARAALPALLIALVRDVELASETMPPVVTVLPVPREEFERGRPARAALVDAFIARRLLTAEQADGAVKVRPAHEALLRVWPEAVRIIAENAALIRVRHTLEPMVAEWTRADDVAKPDHLVTSPALLAGAAQLAHRFEDDLPASMCEFIARSLAADARRRDADKRRQRSILAATAAGLVIALALAGFAGSQWRAADRAERVASEQRNRAEAALRAATETANALVTDLARKFRDRVGMPIDLVRDILDRARRLQGQLLESGETSPELRFSAALALNELVLTLLEQGGAEARADIAAALAVAQRYQAIMAALTAANPGNLEWQYQLSLSHNRLGDVLALAARYQEALEEYSKSLVIRQKLVTADAGNARWQEALATAHAKIGDMLRELGKRVEALDAYDRSLAIRTRLAELDPADAERQRELAVSYERKGLALSQLGQFEEALDVFTRSLEIRQKLTTDQSNAQWRRDLSISYERVGDMLARMGKSEQALAAYKVCFAIRQKLATDDPANKQRQRDLAVIHGRIGEILLALDQRPQALDEFRASLAIQEKLLRDDPGSALWQTDLVITLRRLARAGDDPRGRLTRALEIARKLAAEGKLAAQQRGWVETLEQELHALPN